jgi:hypothetical protein
MIFVVRAISESGYLRQRLVRGAHHRLGGDVEFLVDVGDLTRGAEVVSLCRAACYSSIRMPPTRKRFSARAVRASNLIS